MLISLDDILLREKMAVPQLYNKRVMLAIKKKQLE